jgi:hypothetical protein
MDVYFIGFWWSVFCLSLYIYIYIKKRFIYMIINCFQTFRVSYVVQAKGWKGADNVTFNLLIKLLFLKPVV